MFSLGLPWRPTELLGRGSDCTEISSIDGSISQWSTGPSHTFRRTGSHSAAVLSCNLMRHWVSPASPLLRLSHRTWEVRIACWLFGTVSRGLRLAFNSCSFCPFTLVLKLRLCTTMPSLTLKKIVCLRICAPVVAVAGGWGACLCTWRPAGGAEFLGAGVENLAAGV